MNINEKIYRNVKALCKIYGKDLKDVEREAGRTPGYLSRKSTKVDVEMLIQLSEMFDVSPEEMMNRDYEIMLNWKEATEALETTTKETLKYLKPEEVTEIVNGVLELWKEDN